MQELASVAICVPTFNQAQYLPESVGSACSQTYPNVEVWVSDDASTDDTSKVMAQLCQQFSQVRYYRQLQNLGIAANNTWLLSQPKTEFIIRLDSDDILAPHHIETLLALLQKYPQAGYAHAAVHLIDASSKKIRVKRLVRQEEFYNADKALRKAVSGYRVAANICIFRAKALQELNFYDGRPNYTEDYDLSVRMADAGYGNVYSSEILASYRVWTDPGKIRPKRINIELQGVIRIYEESLLPAFQRRGWNTELIYRHRRQMAVKFAIWLDSPIFNEVERAELLLLLKELGDSPILQLRIALLSWGFGSFFKWQNLVKKKIKDQIKEVVKIKNI